MNLYTMVGSGIGSPAAVALGVRLAAWHDAMVAHERKIRAGRADDGCGEECPHAEARALWKEAVEIFGDRAESLEFLRARATSSAAGSERGSHPPNGSEPRANKRSSHRLVRQGGGPRIAVAEL
jgi:hypothetical protein